jgi:hypothetical protein
MREELRKDFEPAVSLGLGRAAGVRDAGVGDAPVRRACGEGIGVTGLKDPGPWGEAERNEIPW